MLDIHPDMLAQCIDIMDLTNVLCEHPRLQLEHTSLLLVTDGQATLSMNGREEHMVYGHVIVVEKGSVIQLTDTYHMDFSGYFISFRMYDIQTNTPCMYSVNTQAGYAVQKIPEIVLSDTRIALHKAAASDELSVTMKQFILYNLLKELKEERRPEEFTLEERLARTLVHMQQKYNQSINREELAAIAGYSPAYYSRQFMQLYGKTPMEYLIRYRIFRAQEMLLTTGDLSKNVAKKQALMMPNILIDSSSGSWAKRPNNSCNPLQIIEYAFSRRHTRRLPSA